MLGREGCSGILVNSGCGGDCGLKESVVGSRKKAPKIPLGGESEAEIKRGDFGADWQLV